MHPDRQRLEALLSLASRLASEAGGGLLDDSLDLCITGTTARAGAAFLGSGPLERVAERGLTASTDAQALRESLEEIAQAAVAKRRSVVLADVRADRHGLNRAGEIAAIGSSTALAEPVMVRREVLGAMVLLFRDQAELQPNARHYVAAVAQLTALAVALNRDTDARTEPGAPRSQATELGALGSSLAHELMGPVGALLLQVDEHRRLLEQLTLLAGSADTALGGTVAELTELAQDLERAVRRVSDIVEQLSNLGHREDSPVVLELSQPVRDALAVARPQLEQEGIEVSLQLAPDARVLGRNDQLRQVAFELLMNAKEACRHTELAPRVAVRVSAESQQVVLSVDDTGPGLPEGSVREIFQAFYTTERGHRGAGLGLKICNEIVAEHGGHIEVANLPDRGATFRVVLPSATSELAEQAWSRSEGRSRDQAYRILLVDDDPVFARTIRRALKPHDVKTAATASEAEISLLDPSYAPHLVLCDVLLPGANGNDLHARIAQLRPDLADRFVFVTGGALGTAEADYLRSSGCPTLYKPIRVNDILDILAARDGDSAPPRSVRTLASRLPRDPWAP